MQASTEKKISSDRFFESVKLSFIGLLNLTDLNFFVLHILN